MNSADINDQGDAKDRGDLVIPDAAQVDASATPWLRKVDAAVKSEVPEAIGTIGRFVVVGELGRGGMGVVLDAIDRTLGRRVAVKVMHPWVANRAEQVTRFLSEARALAAVVHPNVVTIFDVDMDGDVPLLAMERLRGRTIAEEIAAAYPNDNETSFPRDSGIEVRRVCRWAEQIAEGLAAVHAIGLLHRDVKPSNLWCEAADDRIRILDFGLASRASVDRVIQHHNALSEHVDTLPTTDTPTTFTPTKFTPTPFTRTGSGPQSTHRGGTLHYLAPEQIAGDPPSPRSDLYALGVTLFEMLSGRLPHESVSDRHVATTSETLARISLRDAPDIRSLRPEVGGVMAELIGRLLSRQPEDRPSSAHAVAAEWKAIRESFPRNLSLPPLKVEPKTKPLSRSQSGSRRTFWVTTAITCTIAMCIAEAASRRSVVAFSDSPWRPTATPSPTKPRVLSSPRTESLTRRPGWITAIPPDVHQPPAERGGVLVRHQRLGDDRRSHLLMTIDNVLSHEDDRTIVDAVILLTLQGGITGSEIRQMEWFGMPESKLPSQSLRPREFSDNRRSDADANVTRPTRSRLDLSVADTDGWIAAGRAVSLGTFRFDNADYRKNGDVDAIRFSSAELVRWLNRHPHERLLLWMQRVDISSGQTVFWAEPRQRHTYPKLKLRLHAPAFGKRDRSEGPKQAAAMPVDSGS